MREQITYAEKVLRPGPPELLNPNPIKPQSHPYMSKSMFQSAILQVGDTKDPHPLDAVRVSSQPIMLHWASVVVLVCEPVDEVGVDSASKRLSTPL